MRTEKKQENKLLYKTVRFHGILLWKIGGLPSVKLQRISDTCNSGYTNEKKPRY